MPREHATARSSHAPFPWGSVLAFGFGVLRLSSRDFWTMTLRELNAAFEGVYGRRTEAPRLADFAAMMAAYPDERFE
ncbi:MAG: phage tail assembly chaperone [Methylobacteriaceae bacterium]|nr:phage tail assembly chaperone [Methylobacteriaceae bacterium]